MDSIPDRTTLLFLGNRKTKKKILLHLEKHGEDFGYNMAREMFLRSPTIYEHVGHLKEAGLVESFRKPIGVGNREEIEVYYKLTKLGKEILNEVRD